MIVTEQTPTKLKIEVNNRAWFIVQIIVGSPFCLGALAMIAIFSKLVTLECHLVSFSQTYCQLTSSGILGKTVTRLTTLKHAEVSLNRIKNTKNYKIFLVTQQDKFPLTAYESTNEQEIRRVTKKINTFIRERQQSLKLEYNDRFYPAYFFGFIFILVGSILIVPNLLAPFAISCTFNKETGLLQLQAQSFFGLKLVEHMLNEVDEIKIVIIKSKYSKIYYLSLILRSQQQISLRDYENFSQQKVEEIANQVREFLNLPQSEDI